MTLSSMFLLQILRYCRIGAPVGEGVAEVHIARPLMATLANAAVG